MDISFQWAVYRKHPQPSISYYSEERQTHHTHTLAVWRPCTATRHTHAHTPITGAELSLYALLSTAETTWPLTRGTCVESVIAEQCWPVTLTSSAHTTGLEAACVCVCMCVCVCVFVCSCMPVKVSDCFFVFMPACVFVHLWVSTNTFVWSKNILFCLRVFFLFF